MPKNRLSKEESIDLFELKSPSDLFSEIQLAICEYHENPNSRLFLFLVFSLTHLAEWIAGSSYEFIKSKNESGQELDQAESFVLDILTLEEFKIVKSLCNRSKHYLISQGNNTSISVGATCNSFCSDSLDQTYYLIDG